MPAVPPGGLILVTGASGFVGAQVVKAFLDQGYNVRGTVRSDDKGGYLQDIFKDCKGKFEYVIVKDISAEGAFDEAVRGVDGVAHVASPVTFEAKDPNELIVPAVNGTVGVLNSVLKQSPSTKRVVCTSTTGTIVSPQKPCPSRYSEEDWNEDCVRNCGEQGIEADGGAKYRASKVLAEKAYWKFFEEQKRTFDGVTIHPPMIYGPIIQPCDSPKSLNDSLARKFLPYMTGDMTEKDLPDAGPNFIDVRDVALAHVKAMMIEEAGGNRFVVSGGPYSGNDLCLVLSKEFPEIKGVPRANPNPEYCEEVHASTNMLDGSKAQRVLGMKYRTFQECAKDTIISLRQRFAI
ncbi:hypothetical protein V866_001262 [Kwoniella sp. B9012]